MGRSILFVFGMLQALELASSFAPLIKSGNPTFYNNPTFITSASAQVSHNHRNSGPLFNAENDEDKLTKEEKEELVGNLVADDEWMGLSMEISELVRVAIMEDVKSKTSDFIGKDDYKVGDISKEIDTRVKTEVAKLREKDEYELGDLTIALDTISKELTCELTGKDDYEFGDLSKEIDSRIKGSVATFCGKDTYEVGDLTKEVDRRVRDGVAAFTGKDEYELGDISRSINEKRKAWMVETLGAEAAENYVFGDVTKKLLSNFTGKDDYQFGDVSKKIIGDLFGKRKRGGN